MAKGANIVRLLGIAVPTNMNSLGTIAPVEDLIFFVLSFALYYRCTEDPNPNLTKDDKLAPDADNLKFVLSRVKQSKYIYAVVSLYDLYLSHVASQPLIPSPDTVRLRILRRVGLAILCGGAFLRIWAISVLGRLFTFRLAVRKDHKVVRTGPFAIVRHPSYTGAQIMICGEIILILAGSIGQQYLGTNAKPSWLLFLYALSPAALSSIVLIPRIGKEEKMMLDAFGDDYKRYQHEVPSKLFPGLL